MEIHPITWRKNKIIILDQRSLPTRIRYKRCSDHREVCTAIKEMTIRGAPAIGVAAALGVALGAMHIKVYSHEEFLKKVESIIDEFANTRPTARNLFWALDRMRHTLREKLLTAGIPELKKILIKEALHILEEDIAVNIKIGSYGRSLIKNGDRILTHCNAGALATAGYGTALGIIRAAHEEGKKIHVYVDETRPVLQGARLTAWELSKEGIPHTLITDSMAGFIMKQGKVHMVITGADRIAANGDTANKIGTYSLAVLARHHSIPLYIAAPTSTIDLTIPDGSSIPIEERDPKEVTSFYGRRCAPKKTKAYNPAFDITPAELISAIITEKGIITPPYSEKLLEIHEKKTGLC
ncbi:MAG: S-methyl-5-thioribose-1-phosphate isomerase [Syntrophales bacterium]|nr:S-methyl-5-thioribose-1-phosphate isomerase [Syntrophales bacterium]